MAEELGDLLLQVVFHAEIAAEEQRFTLDDVIHEIAAKLVRRHPHVFGETEVADAAEVVRNWEAIKNTEAGKEDRKSRMDGIPAGFPALLRAHKLQTRAAKDGFDWPDADPVWEKIAEEEAELREAIARKDADAMEDEYGDLLFACVNLGRKLGIDSEAALLRANHKFENRYRAMEDLATEEARPMAGRTLEELDALWMEVKKRRIEANRPNP
jgi:MazG family protein